MDWKEKQREESLLEIQEQAEDLCTAIEQLYINPAVKRAVVLKIQQAYEDLIDGIDMAPTDYE